jgi:hypothetical protein
LWDILLGRLGFREGVKPIDDTGSNFQVYQWLVEVLDAWEILDSGLTMFEVTFVSVLTLGKC